MSDSPLVATDATDSHPYPLDFVIAHRDGIPHRAVHFEIFNDQGNYFVWLRLDGRLEIPGGHVDWNEKQNRPESYEEAALRELCEELNLSVNWKLSPSDVENKLLGRLIPIAKIVNQVPSSHGSNNEWVTVYELRWQSDWGNPCEFIFSEEGHRAARWLSLNEIEELSIKSPMAINSALRLFLQRRGVLIPITESMTRS
ncbi:MAG: NUDIX domain-containing protein [Blastocatellia bacterium]